MADDTFAILPPELVEQIGLELAKIVQCGKDIENEMERATVQVRTLRNLILVNTRFNHIFTPQLYRQVVLHTENSKSSFSKFTAGNRRLCDQVSVLLYSDRANASRFHNVDSKETELDTFLLYFPNIITIQIWKVLCFTRHHVNRSPDLTSLSRLHTLELIDQQWLPGIAHTLSSILPQIDHFRIVGEQIRIDPLLYSRLTGLKSIRIRSTRHAFEVSLDGVFMNLGTKRLEEIDLDSTIPYTMFLEPHRFVSLGRLDRWRSTLRVFRFKGDPIENGLRMYLDNVLADCEIIDITAIPVKPGEGHQMQMWMG